MATVKSSSKNKRKGENESDTSVRTSVVFSPRIPLSEHAAAWRDTKNRLASVLESCSGKSAVADPFDSDIDTLVRLQTTDFAAAQQAKLRKAAQLHDRLRIAMDDAQRHNEDESAAILALRDKWQAYHRHGESIRAQTALVDQQCDTLQTETEAWMTAAKDASTAVEQQSRQQSQQVPRLQQQISLYGNMTGIKWDFEAQESKHAGESFTQYLIGQVNVPSENVIRQFEIDRAEYSPYHLADRLWTMMEGEAEKV